jgi:hypothetical protein
MSEVGVFVFAKSAEGTGSPLEDLSQNLLVNSDVNLFENKSAPLSLKKLYPQVNAIELGI